MSLFIIIVKAVIVPLTCFLFIVLVMAIASEIEEE